MSAPLSSRLLAETVGTAFLLAAVVGSGIMAERLAGGNVALALLANTFATGAALVALILALGDVSSHFNPAVTLMAAVSRELAWREVPAYVAVQIGAAFAGVWMAHAMFATDILQASVKARGGLAQAWSEWVATLGLLVVIAGTAAHRGKAMVAFAVGGYIAAAYWFTASTSFANPAATLARSATATFAGIRAADVPLFIVAQLLALAFAAWLVPALFGRRGK